MRSLLLLTLLLSFIDASAEDGYIIIDAVNSSKSEDQPKWIALAKGKKVHHVQTGQTITSLPVGHYWIHHIDSNENFRIPSHKTRFAKNSEASIHFEVESNSIVYIGMLELYKESERRGFNVRTLSSKAFMINWACESHGELLRRLPVRVPGEEGSFKKISVRCQD